MTAHLTSWIADLGLAGIFALMALDAVVPAGGELIMLFAGALAAGAISGHPASSLAAAVAAGTLGYLAGSIGGWALGRAGVVLTTIASLIWCAAFGIAGYALGVHWDSVHHAFRYADYAAVTLLAAAAAAVLVRQRRAVAS